MSHFLFLRRRDHFYSTIVLHRDVLHTFHLLILEHGKIFFFRKIWNYKNVAARALAELRLNCREFTSLLKFYDIWNIPRTLLRADLSVRSRRYNLNDNQGNSPELCGERVSTRTTKAVPRESQPEKCTDFTTFKRTSH